MSEPAWPISANYVCDKPSPCLVCDRNYERARADAAIARLRLAVEVLEFTRAHIAKSDWHGSIHGRAFNALHEIGPIPE
jgi:hypothetical protein